MLWQAHVAEEIWTCLTVCLSNHDKSFISQELEYLLAKQISGIRHEKKKHTPVTNRLLKVFSSICLRLEAFDERALLGTFLTIKIILSLIESDLTVISILRVADFSWWYILFLSSLQEKQSSELFWLISERVRHFRPKVAFAKRAFKWVKAWWNNVVKIKTGAANLITSWPFKIKLINSMAPRYIVNAIPGLSRFLWGAELHKNFILVQAASNSNLIEAVLWG